MKIELAHRIRELPPYLFARIDALKNEERKKGKDLIDLGIGDPDLPTPPHVVAALQRAAENPAHHRYPSYAGMMELRRAAADFCAKRFAVEFDGFFTASSEDKVGLNGAVLILSGSTHGSGCWSVFGFAFVRLNDERHGSFRTNIFE